MQLGIEIWLGERKTEEKSNNPRRLRKTTVLLALLTKTETKLRIDNRD
jgi:hypothetical protein